MLLARSPHFQEHATRLSSGRWSQVIWQLWQLRLFTCSLVDFQLSSPLSLWPTSHCCQYYLQLGVTIRLPASCLPSAANCPIHYLASSQMHNVAVFFRLPELLISSGMLYC